MKLAFIALAVVVVLGGALLLAVLYFAGNVAEAHGKALHSGYGAWKRIQEFAHASGKANYIAHADENVRLLEHDWKEWREMYSYKDLKPFDQLQAQAYATTDQNIKNGQNPLAFLDVPQPTTQK